MKLVNQLRAKLESIGASLEETDYTLHCDAPSGYVWRANGCACIAIHYATNRQTWLADAIRNDGLPRLSLGLEKVTAPADIEAHRYELGDDTWGAPDSAPDKIAWPTAAPLKINQTK